MLGTWDILHNAHHQHKLHCLQIPSSLNLGPETGESFDLFDDFDDFNQYTKIDSSMPSAIFKIECDVDYVNLSNFDGISSKRTWHKKITVIITSSLMSDTLIFSSVYSYWHFR